MKISHLPESARDGFSSLSPMVKLIGVAFYICWILVIYSGDPTIVRTTEAYRWTALGFVFSTGALVLGLVLLSFSGRRGYALITSSNRMILVGLGTAVCTAIECLPEAVPLPLYCIAAAGTGLLTAVIAMRSAAVMAELDAKRSLMVGAFILVAALLGYTFTSFMTVYFSSWAAFIIVCLLPILAVALLFAESNEDRELYRTVSSAVPKGFWRLVAVAFVLPCVFCMVRGYFPNFLGVSEFALARAMTAVGIIMFVTVILGVVSVMPRNARFGAVCYWLLLASSLAVVLIPLLGMNSQIMGAAGDTLFAAVAFSIWIVLVNICHGSGASILRVFGLGFGSLGLGATTGYLIGAGLFALNAQSGTISAVSLGVVVAAVILASIILRREDLYALMMPIVEEDAPAPSGAQIVEQRAPVFRMRCAMISAKYNLSRRESEVLTCMAKGKDAAAIAEELCISFNTSRTHIRNIYAKCGVHSRHEFVKLIDSSEG